MTPHRPMLEPDVGPLSDEPSPKGSSAYLIKDPSRLEGGGAKPTREWWTPCDILGDGTAAAPDSALLMTHAVGPMLSRKAEAVSGCRSRQCDTSSLAWASHASISFLMRCQQTSRFASGRGCDARNASSRQLERACLCARARHSIPAVPAGMVVPAGTVATGARETSHHRHAGCPSCKGP